MVGCYIAACRVVPVGLGRLRRDRSELGSMMGISEVFRLVMAAKWRRELAMDDR